MLYLFLRVEPPNDPSHGETQKKQERGGGGGRCKSRSPPPWRKTTHTHRCTLSIQFMAFSFTELPSWLISFVVFFYWVPSHTLTHVTVAPSEACTVKRPWAPRRSSILCHARSQLHNNELCHLNYSKDASKRTHGCDVNWRKKWLCFGLFSSSFPWFLQEQIHAYDTKGI